jgi:hypothetical protein
VGQQQGQQGQQQGQWEQQGQGSAGVAAKYVKSGPAAGGTVNDEKPGAAAEAVPTAEAGAATAAGVRAKEVKSGAAAGGTVNYEKHEAAAEATGANCRGRGSDSSRGESKRGKKWVCSRGCSK